MSTQTTSFTASNTPIDGTTVVTSASVSTDLLNLIQDYNLKVGTNKIDLTSVLGSVYPVGSIYTNASVATNPATLLGFGTWNAFGAGRVMVGLDAGQTEFDAIGETGGEKKHTLATTEMPAHNHIGDANYMVVAGGSGTGLNITTTGGGYNVGTTSTGGGQAHNNLQPYVVVYMWQRTA